MPDSLHFFETLLGHRFQDKSLLTEAITHSSYANERNCICNERLEFLGDAVLDIVVSDYLFSRTPAISEGEMTRVRSQSVCEKALAAHATKMNIGAHLRLGKGEAASGGATRPSVLADAMEALIAALYLDGGREKTQKFVLSFCRKRLRKPFRAVPRATIKQRCRKNCKAKMPRRFCMPLFRKRGRTMPKNLQSAFLWAAKSLEWASAKRRRQQNKRPQKRRWRMDNDKAYECACLYSAPWLWT